MAGRVVVGRSVCRRDFAFFHKRECKLGLSLKCQISCSTTKSYFNLPPFINRDLDSARGKTFASSAEKGMSHPIFCNSPESRSNVKHRQHRTQWDKKNAFVPYPCNTVISRFHESKPRFIQLSNFLDRSFSKKKSDQVD